MFPPLYPPILKPDANLCLCQSQLTGQSSSLLARNVLIVDKNFLQLVQLFGRKYGASSLRPDNLVVYIAEPISVFHSRGKVCTERKQYMITTFTSIESNGILNISYYIVLLGRAAVSADDTSQTKHTVNPLLSPPPLSNKPPPLFRGGKLISPPPPPPPPILILHKKINDLTINVD